ncbi:hypothetical protein A3G67_01525 [Candidatus Roizmanbacteria bacterium RIFCSPLOWO2_12_FULL_40_12]|uniref:Uncharacterized protein n=1 Tax=Candidatus Roizmanbacteria bacterium RIFCSPLOWO2_01_FULL_40_42 TaxID=1802066 RepID=A0A1F7J6J6_9BACT|nr:MAG: hypothetical protein A2779_02430 [Candidatus Roizmanbacteria bacterium RIFCSPHIGHO2_01_FULL_40_98]OGK29077.1 MAG: hypothetical protein A3C31_03215 [Candidatus Roizmanbacteria bacterium RIFCSPHIGHO2_02_FULL_40_53]OGK29823.1 MAG: hypothetical protein A2W49_04610 [Candidatus Roizmanbacteria bacterium RIFCSPHIGHO2_12_41_18]OGK36218.1 MAG: hypothetical protein A3E69_01255 [Candidatus Roizmanbacteria bacterium RIFCSPHIGHO2_12_FULL_40_130]OGK51231.1 MAG: hypothetical protein A3B50_03365 [Candi
MRHLKQTFKIWFPIAIGTTLICSLVFSAVQQDLRQSANDPQIQLAEDGAYKIEKGFPPSHVLPSDQVEISRSLAPYVIVFDSKGNYLASSATLDGKPPTLPVGVFGHAKENGQHRVTWQPRPDVRSAVVIVPFKGSGDGFVVAGKSLREVEDRVDKIKFMALFVWVTTLIVTFAAALLMV